MVVLGRGAVSYERGTPAHVSVIKKTRPNDDDLLAACLPSVALRLPIKIISDEDPLRGSLFCWDLGFSHTLHLFKERRQVVYLRSAASRLPVLVLTS